MLLFLDSLFASFVDIFPLAFFSENGKKIEKIATKRSDLIIIDVGDIMQVDKSKTNLLTTF